MFSDQDVSDFLDTLEYDLINLCEDNEEMKKPLESILRSAGQSIISALIWISGGHYGQEEV